MTVLVLGATGATGRLVVNQLLGNGEIVKVLVRSKTRFAQLVASHTNLEVIEADFANLPVEQWQQQLKGINSVISCLGHTMTIKGLYGHPRRLVSDVVTNIYHAIEKMQPTNPIKYVLMNTTGARNPDLNEQHSTGEKVVIGMLRHLLPPHADNEEAAHFLRTQVGSSNPMMSWVIVRPDSLIDSPTVTEYLEETSPTRSPIFNSGQTSRINVGNFMMRLVVENDTWQQWQGKTPVLYNSIEIS